MNLSEMFLLFICYSFIGWVIEVIYEYFVNGKLVNRGFLIGPYCPIYGVGGLIATITLTSHKDSVIILFVMSMFMFALLEYFTSYLMEKLFKARWWDYSNYKFNVNGRVCLYLSCLFGLGGGLPITLSTEIPNNESTHGTVTSSKSVYDFVTNQITVVNQSITDLTEDTDEKFVLVDENFDQVEQRFQTVEQSIENTNNNLNGKIDSEVLRLDGLIEEINEAMKQIGDLLDEINGVEKSSEESSDSSYEEESSSSEEI